MKITLAEVKGSKKFNKKKKKMSVEQPLPYILPRHKNLACKKLAQK